MNLNDAGYRERAFAKSWLVGQGRIEQWLPKAMEYNPNTDHIKGIGKVKWEGSRSREILAEYGLDDRDCH